MTVMPLHHQVIGKEEFTPAFMQKYSTTQITEPYGTTICYLYSMQCALRECFEHHSLNSETETQ